MHIKPYYCYIKDINISFLKIINNLAKNFADKTAHEKILILLDYFKPKKLH